MNTLEKFGASVCLATGLVTGAGCAATGAGKVETEIPEPPEAPDAGGPTAPLAPDSDPKKTAGWLSARSLHGRAIEVRLETRDKIAVTTTGGDLVTLEGQCPDPDLHTGWTIDSGAIARGGTNVPRLAEQGHGAFEVIVESPHRPGDAVKGEVACTKPGATAGAAAERLALPFRVETRDTVAAKPTRTPQPRPLPVAPPPRTPRAERLRRLFQVGAAVGTSPGDNVAFEARARVAPVHERQWYRRFLLGVLGRFAKNKEDIATREGTVRHEPWTQVVAGTATWQPRVADGEAVIDLEVGGGAGVGHVNGARLDFQRSVEDETTVVGVGDIGVQVGGERIRGRIGATCITANQEALQGCSGTVGVIGEF